MLRKDSLFLVRCKARTLQITEQFPQGQCDFSPDDGERMFHPQSICATSEDVKMAKAVQTPGPPSPVVPLRSKGENRARTHD